MARPREFDEASVLDAAIDKFWRNGYEATSVRDLADEMKIAGASLYNAFGDKRTLYARALNRYLDQSFRERIHRLEPNHPPREAFMLKMTHLSKAYRTEVVETYALRDFSINVREGEFVAVTGPSKPMYCQISSRAGWAIARRIRGSVISSIVRGPFGKL